MFETTQISRRALSGLAIAAMVGGPAGAEKTLKTTLRTTLDPTNPANLPLLVALDRGYFAAQGIDLDVNKLTASSTTLMPLLARGDLDIAPIAVSGAFFNQFSAGFDIKLIASSSTTQSGWQDMSWIVVRQEIWALGKINTAADLKGLRVELGPDGSPLMALMLGVLRMGGLSIKDVNAVQHVRSMADMFTALRNNAVDAVGIPEPGASLMQKEGYGHKWLSVQAVNPGTQELFIAASGKFVTEHRDVVRRFLMAHLQGEQDVLQAGPKWTPATLATYTKWSGFTETQAREFDGPTYPGSLGRIDVGVIASQQKLWQSLGKITQPVDIANVVDQSVLDEARKAIGLDK